MSRLPLLCVLCLAPGLPLADVNTYGAPSAPVYGPQPQSYQGSAQLPNADYYKHEHHHFYHAGPPKVVQVAVPVTQKPYVVQVPQNVPVQFVGVNVPTPAPPPPRVIQVQPQYGQYTQPQHIHHYPVDNACHGFDLDCVAKAGKDILGDGARIAGVGNTGYGYGYQGYDQGYVTRKELVKSGLLLGAGILKGALLTTVINNINNNNNGK